LFDVISNTLFYIRNDLQKQQYVIELTYRINIHSITLPTENNNKYCMLAGGNILSHMAYAPTK